MSSTDEQVIDFHYELFDCIFTKPFRPKITDRLRRDAVARQVQEAAGAASQALTRFFQSEQLTTRQVKEILRGFESIYGFINLEDIGNPNRTPEALVEEFLVAHPCPAAVSKADSSAVYRVALHQTFQVLMLVGPVMAEWQKLSFASTYEMPRKIVNQLNQITEGLKALTSAGQDAVDERYELTYRDHLLQRFYRVEAGTVKMTTSLNVDLRELFVMPRVKPRSPTSVENGEGDVNALMSLAAARAIFQHRTEGKSKTTQDEDETVPAIEQLRCSKRNVIIGVPGGGKSTLFEWLQLSLASVEEELIAGAGQAIPLLLRVRQLDPEKLPSGADLIEKATASHDRAALMPSSWIARQMRAGRVLFMLDGLDETEPDIRDNYILPWLTKLCDKFPDCLYLVSSRPVGYPPGTLQKLNFVECDLQDFDESQIGAYTRHWCTAIRIAQNDPDEEARREGAKEGDQIVEGFKGHPYIRNLARNPLMLSAICLVNYFEGGQLPKDRAVLYRLCVEGLLHHWDQRRGIHSEYSLDEKLRVCREVAIAMQADDRAEYEAEKVLKIFVDVLNDKYRAVKLLEHIRYRTGLLIERRSKVFAFAHLTFQEYLAACAVYEGNGLGITPEQLAAHHAKGLWNEVMALYCGLASGMFARQMLRSLINQADTRWLSAVLSEAFLSSNTELLNDKKLRATVLARLAVAPYSRQLDHYSPSEVAPVANRWVGCSSNNIAVSEAFVWLMSNPNDINFRSLEKRIQNWANLAPQQTSELQGLLHRWGSDEILLKVAADHKLYSALGTFSCGTQAELAISWLAFRLEFGPGAQKALVQCLRILHNIELQLLSIWRITTLFRELIQQPYRPDPESCPELIFLARKLADTLDAREALSDRDDAINALRSWADMCEQRLNQTVNSRNKRTRKSSSKNPSKALTKRRRK